MYFRKKEFLDVEKGIKNQIDIIIAELKNIGSSYIICRKKHNKLYYSERCGTSERGITQDPVRISQLAKKEYLTEMLTLLTANLKTIQYCCRHYIDITPENIAKSISARIKHLPPELVINANSSPWKSKPYTKNPYHTENLQYVTTNGIVVRSKSEREIANTLEAMGIPYKYDVKIQCGYKSYYADFVIERPDGTLLIWEHFGMENDKNYMAGNETRIKDYLKLGYRPWDNLIWTLESDIKDSRTIRTIIQRFILCDMNAA